MPITLKNERYSSFQKGHFNHKKFLVCPHTVQALTAQGFIPTDHQTEWIFLFFHIHIQISLFFQCKIVRRMFKIAKKPG